MVNSKLIAIHSEVRSTRSKGTSFTGTHEFVAKYWDTNKIRALFTIYRTINFRETQEQRGVMATDSLKPL